LAACSFVDKHDPSPDGRPRSSTRSERRARQRPVRPGDQALRNLEARFPYGRYSQQGQLEIAYAYYKQNEPASAVAATERFVKLHPNSPNVDYAHYLKGLAYFNEDLGILGRMARQDRTERDPKSARESFDAFKELFSATRIAVRTRRAGAHEILVNALASHEFMCPLLHERALTSRRRTVRIRAEKLP